MNNTQPSRTMDIDAKIKEAEAYRTMGLFMESLAAYEMILSDSPQLDSYSQTDISERIGLVKKEIEDLEKTESKVLSDEELSIFKETLAIDEDVSTVLDSASAFRELGIYGAAITEYEKLFFLVYPPEKIVPDYTETFLSFNSPVDVVKQVEDITGDERLENKDKAQIKFFFGMEMEKRDHKDLAMNLYSSAMDLDPGDTEIQRRLDSIISVLSAASKYDYLLSQDVVTTDQLQEAVSISKKMKKSVEFVLVDHFKVAKEALGKSFSYFYGCPFVAYDPELPVPFELLGNLKESFLLNNLWVPLSWGIDGVNVLIDDPRDLAKTGNISSLVKSKKISFSVGIKEDIQAYVKRFFSGETPEESTPSEEVIEDFDLVPDVAFEEEEEVEDEAQEFDEASGKVVRLVDQILVSAYRKSSSDIHIEPSPITKATTIRFRIDGVCKEFMSVPNSMAKAMLSRLKIMSGLDIAEKRLPQDGKIKFKRKGILPFELRVATLPSAGGYEDAVLRILASAGAMKLDEMGLNERNLEIMEKVIAQPYGLVLVVGPTGSGKTTSLHAALGHINKPEIKIWTAEDPVEITQFGLRQIEAKPKIGLDFARIMRAFLRADPDVIMIGEMRDEETASISIEASLTGHLVFSTLHTNSAPETVTRLLDMGLNPLNFSDAFLGVMAQRLVRRLCRECCKEYHPTEEEFEDIVNYYGKEYFQGTGIEFTSELTLKRPVGCEKCSGTGYRGRLGIHELMEGTPETKRLIKKQASTDLLLEQAIKDGMTTLKQDGIMKVFQGLTDMSEVRRVCIN
ncbi:MAG: ATPase, T2SS/T4P/T4SS family [Thermodesulfobacteriota bacterium]|nr:ATPase, T2SS/T4P/T4SS family [Thermodesulfobacteriota bacterium]